MRNGNKNNTGGTFSDNSGTWNIPNGHHVMNKGAYQFKDNEESILELIQRITDGFRRLYIAAKYQFHRSTFGIFRSLKASWVKTAFISLAVYVVFFRGENSITSLESPVTWATEMLETGTSNPVNWASSVTMAGSSENPFAPASPADLREQPVKKYINRFTKVAVAEMDKYGVPASILMAQGIIESRCGSSILASKVNNHFGIKCFSKKCKKGHCTNFEDDFHKDFFRTYTSAWESWRDHSILLSSGRYKALHENGKDYNAWAKGLKRLGYATDNSYDTKLISIIKKYQLDRLDDL